MHLTSPATALSAVITQHGDPATVLTVIDIPLRTPGPDEVVLRMRCAPINPADLNVIEGTYGRLPPLPAVIGNEGVGEVIVCGSAVTTLKPGDVVRPGDGVGTWCTWAVARADACIKLPRGLTVDQVAQLTVNPATAWRVLADFVELTPGDWVVQNAATSAVGRCLIALCREQGIKTINLVRCPESAAELTALGADVVLPDDRAAAKAIAAIVGDRPPRLALNAVGGDSAATLAKVLAPRGTLVTIGAMARQPLTIPNGPLIFKELRAVGFWISAWYRRASLVDRDGMLHALAALCAAGRLPLPVAQRYSLRELSTAVARAREGGRSGKVLLDLCD